MINKKYGFLLLGLVLGVVISGGYLLVSAHGGNTNFIHGCARTSGILANGQLRMVGPNDNCNAQETAVDWNQNGINDFGGFTTKDLIGINLSNEYLAYRDFEGANLTNADMHEVILSKANLKNSNFAETNFNLANFSDSNLSGSTFDTANASESNFTNSNLTNVTFNNTDLRASIGMSTAIRTGVVWVNSNVCPDGTRSDENGNTCEGHLAP